MSKSLLTKDLETRIFSRVCLIMASVAFISLVLDLLFTPVPLFLLVDVMVFSVLGIFFYLINYKLPLKYLVYPFIIFMVIMVNISWSVSGQGMAVGYIYFFILILFLIITHGTQRLWVAGLVIVNVIVLTIIQVIYPDFGSYSMADQTDENLSTGIGLAALFGLTTYVIGYLKRSYEAERIKVNKKNAELEEKNHQIEAQNEELRQYQDQIVAQRDEIERNVLELKKANQHINEVNHSLENIVKERTSELDELFYRSSHDFRQPLTTLMGLTYLAKVTLKDEYSSELFSKVELTTCKMDKMLGKFLMNYEINHFNDKPPERCSFGEVINDIKSELIKDQSFVKLNVNKEVKKYSLNDPRNHILKFILINLIDNAINFKKEGDVHIDINVKEVEDELKISVLDNGIGIPKDQLNRIFDMFVRTNEVSTGNGMGLYVVKKGVEKLNGSVVCESEEGEYSKFDISFPI